MKELTPEEQEVMLSSDLRPQLRTFLQNRIAYLSEVNYDLGLQQMLLNAGLWIDYEDHMPFEINPYTFKVSGSGIVRVELHIVGFDRDILPGDAIVAIKAMGLQPGRVEHLIAFVTSNHRLPQHSCQFMIVALDGLGKDSEEKPAVATLDYRNNKFTLGIEDGSPDEIWRGWVRFIAYKVVG